MRVRERVCVQRQAGEWVASADCVLELDGSQGDRPRLDHGVWQQQLLQLQPAESLLRETV